MAEVWESWSENGTEFQSFTIITTDANEVVRELHDRMPVMLDREEDQRWLEVDDLDTPMLQRRISSGTSRI